MVTFRSFQAIIRKISRLYKFWIKIKTTWRLAGTKSISFLLCLMKNNIACFNTSRKRGSSKLCNTKNYSLDDKLTAFRVFISFLPETFVGPHAALDSNRFSSFRSPPSCTLSRPPSALSIHSNRVSESAILNLAFQNAVSILALHLISNLLLLDLSSFFLLTTN